MRISWAIAACILGVISSNSNAADWKFVGSGDTKSDYYIDQSSIIKAAQYKYAWIKDDAKNNKAVQYREAKRWQAFDCVNKRISIATTIEYLPDGSVLYNKDYSDSATNFETIIPDTVGETWYNLICIDK